MHIIVIAGAAIIVLLGIAHAVFTFQSNPEAGPMMPTDPTVVAAMQTRGGLGMAPHIDSNLYKAWIGFNLSHSIGLVVGGLVIAVPVLRNFEAALDDPLWLVTAIALPPMYLALSVRYWFADPTRAIAFASLLIVGGTVVGRIVV